MSVHFRFRAKKLVSMKQIRNNNEHEGEYISDSELDSSVCAEFSRDRYACEVYDQFVNQEEPMMTDDCIRNYMFLADPNPCDGNPVLLSSCEHYSDKEIVIFDDHELISRGQEDDQSSCRGTVMAEQEAAIDVQLFPEKQHVSYLPFKDPVAAFMDLYFSENLKISDFLSLPMFMGDSFGSAANAKGSHQLSVLQTKGNCSRNNEQRDDQRYMHVMVNNTYQDQIASFKRLKNDEQIFISAYDSFESTTDLEQPAFNNEISKGSFQHLFNLQLDQQSKEVLLYEFDDPFADYLESMNNIDVKKFLSEEDCLYHLFKPLFCMISLPLLFGSRSRILIVNQFMIWLHWKFHLT
jgi:hypothetical protein